MDECDFAKLWEPYSRVSAGLQNRGECSVSVVVTRQRFAECPTRVSAAPTEMQSPVY